MHLMAAAFGLMLVLTGVSGEECSAGTDAAIGEASKIISFIPAAARVVILGESSHGVAEFSQLRAQIFTALRQEDRAELLLVEGPVAGCFEANQLIRAGGSAEQAAKGCIFPVSRDAHAVAAISQLQGGGGRPASVVGLDVQTGDTDLALRFFQRREALINSIGKNRFDAIRDALVMLSRGPRGWTDGKREAASALAIRLDLLSTALPSPGAADQDLLILRLAVQSLAADLRLQSHLSVNDWVAAAKTRSTGMARNLKEVIAQSNGKGAAVVWTHSSHAQYRRSYAVPVGGNRLGAGSGALGAVVRDLIPESERFSINMYAYGGQGRANDGSLYFIPGPRPDSVEEVCIQSGLKTGLLLVRSPSDVPKCWATKLLTTTEWSSLVALRPIDQFDAALCVDGPRPIVR